MTVLILDDDARYARQLRDYLEKNGVNVKIADSVGNFEHIIGQDDPDVAILDAKAGGQAFEVVKYLRAKGVTLPILLTSASGELADKILGFELGADDYLAKPFERREMLARLRALTRFRATANDGIKKHGPLTLDHGRCKVILEGRDLAFSFHEFECLSMLASASGKVLTRTQLMECLTGLDHNYYGRSIDVLVSRLRQKLGDDAHKPRFIKSVYGTGYVFLKQSF